MITLPKLSVSDALEFYMGIRSVRVQLDDWLEAHAATGAEYVYYLFDTSPGTREIAYKFTKNFMQAETTKAGFLEWRSERNQYLPIEAAGHAWRVVGRWRGAGTYGLTTTTGREERVTCLDIALNPALGLSVKDKSEVLLAHRFWVSRVLLGIPEYLHVVENVNKEIENAGGFEPFFI